MQMEMRALTHSTLISACNQVTTRLDRVCLRLIMCVFVHKLKYVNVSPNVFADKSLFFFWSP